MSQLQTGRTQSRIGGAQRTATRLATSSLALATALACIHGEAAAQSFEGTPTVTFGQAQIVEGPGTTRVDAETTQVVIDWVPDNQGGAGNIVFQPTSTSATFSNSSELIPDSDFAVLNRIIPTDSSRTVEINGAIDSLIVNSSQVGVQGGSIFFYSPGGILVGNTAAINVGSLVLTTSDPLVGQTGFIDAGNTVSFQDATQAGSRVTISQDATINALASPFYATQGYVAVVAPVIDHQGDIFASDTAALVSADSADITFSPDGLFDITVNSGTSGAGTTLSVTGVINQQVGNPVAQDFNRIYLVAVPKNDAITMAISGGAELGFVIADNVAQVGGNTIVLSAGSDVQNGITVQAPAANSVADANLSIANASFGGDIDAAVKSNMVLLGATDVRGSITADVQDSIAIQAITGDINIADFADFDTSMWLGSPILPGEDGATGAISVIAANGSTIDFAGNVLFESNALGADGDQFITTGGDGIAGGIEVVADGGTITVGGNLEFNASAIGGSASGLGGTGFAGNIALVAVSGGSIDVAGTTLAQSTGTGGARGTGFGGNIIFLAQAGGSLSSDSFGIFADGVGGNADTGGQTAGTGVGGTVDLSAIQGTITQTGTAGSSLSAVGIGGFDSSFGEGFGISGGIGQGGGISIVSDGASASMSLAFQDVDASGYGGSSGYGAYGGSGGAGFGGNVVITAAGGGQMVIDNAIEVYAVGAGGDGLAAANGYGGSIIMQSLAGGSISGPGFYFVAEGVGGYASSSGAGAAAGSGYGGDITIEAIDGTISQTASNVAYFYAGGGASQGKSSGPAGNGTGGGISLTAVGSSGSISFYGAYLSTVGTGASSYGGFDGGNGTGGQILVATADGGALEFTSVEAGLGIYAEGIGGSTYGGSGGSATGGSAIVDLASGSLTATSITVDAGASGGFGTISGGTAQGGTARILNTVGDATSASGMLTVTTATVDASAQGGAGYAYGGDAGTGGSAFGGVASFQSGSVDSGIVSSQVADLTVIATASGGNSITVGDGTQGGVGGDAQGGTAIVTIEAGSGTATFDTATVNAVAIGGAGGMGGAGDGVLAPGAGGAGGTATGGLAEASVRESAAQSTGGHIQFGQLDVRASAQGGAGGAGGTPFASEAAGAGGDGGDAFAGLAQMIAIGGELRIIDGGTVTAFASGNGGGQGSTVGSGGDAFVGGPGVSSGTTGALLVIGTDASGNVGIVDVQAGSPLDFLGRALGGAGSTFGVGTALDSAFVADIDGELNGGLVSFTGQYQVADPGKREEAFAIRPNGLVNAEQLDLVSSGDLSFANGGAAFIDQLNIIANNTVFSTYYTPPFYGQAILGGLNLSGPADLILQSDLLINNATFFSFGTSGIIDVGAVETQGGLDFQASTITIRGTVDAAQIALGAAGPITTGDVISDASVLVSGGDLVSLGTVSAVTSVDISAGADLTLDGVGGTDIALASATNLLVGGGIAASGGVGLMAGNTITVFGPIVGDVVTASAGDLAFADIMADTLIDLDASGALVAADLNSGGAITAGGNTVTAGSVTAGTSVDIGAATAISIGNVGGSQVSLTAGTTLAAGTIDANATAALASGSSTTTAALAADTIIIDAGTSVTTGSLSAVDSIGVTAGGNIVTGAIDGAATGTPFATTPDLTVELLSTGGSITTGAIEGQDGVGLYAATDITTGTIGATSGIGTVALLAGNDVTVSGGVLVNLDGQVVVGNYSMLGASPAIDGTRPEDFAALPLVAIGGNLVTGAISGGSFNGAVAGDATLTSVSLVDTFDLTAGGTIGVTGNLSASNGVAIDADAFALGNVSGAVIDLAATNNLVTGALISSGAVTLDAGGLITTTNVSTNSLNASAAGALTTGNISVTNGIVLDGNAITTGALSSASLDLTTATSIATGAIDNLGLVNLVASGAITTGDVTASGFVATTGGSVLTGDVRVSGAIAVDGDAIATGALSGADVDLSAATNLTTLGIDVSGPAILAAGGALTTGNVSAGSVVASAGGALSTGSVIATDAILLDGNAITTGALTGSAVDLASATSLVAGAVNAATLVNLDAGTTLATGNISAQAVSATAGGSLGTGNVAAAGNVDLTSGGAIVSGNISGDLVTLTGQLGVSAQNLTATTGFAAIAAQGPVTIGGTWSTGGTVANITASDLAILGSGAISAPNATLAIRSNTPAGMTLGTFAGATGFVVDEAEFAQINAGSLAFAAQGGADTITIGDLTINRTATNLVSGNGFISFVVTGAAPTSAIRVVGNFVVDGLVDTNQVLFGADTLTVDAANGGVFLQDGNGGFAGELVSDARVVRVAEPGLLAQFAADPAFAGRVVAVNTPTATSRPGGVFNAGAITLTNAEQIVVQNTGTTDLPAGFYVTNGFGEVLSPSVELLINGQLADGSGGVITGNDVAQIIISEQEIAYTDNSTVNGCVLITNCETVIVPPISLLPPGPLAPPSSEITMNTNTRLPDSDPFDSFAELEGGSALEDEGLDTGGFDPGEGDVGSGAGGASGTEGDATNSDESDGKSGQEHDEDDDEEDDDDVAKAPISAPQPVITTEGIATSPDVREPVSGGGNPALIGSPLAGGANSDEGESE